ncbi:MAG TPA: AtpZ/AtpI family protein [Thermoanaerobaculia bacterium]|nr:AtpZ/AtpI family protein [Thermoanaerobaculia bacterium]
MSKDDEQKRLLGRASGIGIELAAAVAGLSLAGYWVDRHYGSGPWGLLIGLALGLIGGTYNLVRESLVATKDAERADREDRDGER